MFRNNFNIVAISETMSNYDISFHKINTSQFEVKTVRM